MHYEMIEFNFLKMFYFKKNKIFKYLKLKKMKKMFAILAPTVFIGRWTLPPWLFFLCVK